MRYSENHHLNSDDGGTNAHVALHLQGASLLRAMEFVDAVLAAAGEFVLEAEAPAPLQGATVLRPQTSGPCVHIDQADDKDPKEIQALGLACRHPGRLHQRDGECPQEWECPHLDNPDVLCSVRDACYAMHEVIRMRDVCEAEQEEQVSSLCGYYDERSEHADNIDPCTHPDACKTGCPYLDDDGIYCPQKDGWSAASKQAEEDLAWAWGDDLPEFVSLAQDPEGRGHDLAAEAADQVPRSDYVLAPRDPQEQDADMAAVAPSQTYETAAPEWVEPEPEEAPVYTTPAGPKGAPAHVTEWTAEEDAAIRDATTAAESVTLYRSAVPDSGRSDAAIRARWYKKVRPGLCEARDPLPDFVGDVVPVTQCEEPAFLPGDRVRITHALHRGHTGKIERYFPATENYLVAIDGMPDMIVLTDAQMEAV